MPTSTKTKTTDQEALMSEDERIQIAMCELEVICAEEKDPFTVTTADGKCAIKEVLRRLTAPRAQAEGMRSAWDWALEGEKILINGKYLSKSDHEKFITRIQQDALACRQHSAPAWQPIETAPRDGTEVDLLVNGHRITDVYWSTKTRNGIPHWVFPEIGGCTDKEATFWMPLPAPPEDER